MMSSWHWAILSLTLLSQQAVALNVKPRSDFNWGDIKYVYAFRDSYTFVEGKEGLVNFRLA